MAFICVSRRLDCSLGSLVFLYFIRRTFAHRRQDLIAVALSFKHRSIRSWAVSDINSVKIQ